MTVRRTLARWSGWSADALRFVHAAFYWNARKWLFRRRGATGRCPCQNPSDEPKLGPVRCDVVLLWDQPGRFRPLCPLLVQTSEGWRCSVAASDVRPFWGRAFGFGLAGFALAYLVATLGLFAFFRWGNDLPVRMVDLAWPGHWHRVRLAQSQRLFAHAIGAFQRGRLHEAFLALSSARERNPGNYEASVLIGQVTMFQGSYSFADGVFEQLRREQPAHAFRTSVVYHDTLLMLQRYEQLAAHALARAGDDPGHAALWVQSLLFALRTGDFAPRFAAEHRAAIDALSPHAQLLIAAETELAGGFGAAALARLSRPFSGPLNPSYMEVQVERVATLGAVDTAQALLDAYGPLLGEFRHALAQFRLDLRRGDESGAAATFRHVLAVASTSEQWNFVVAALVDQPHPLFYSRLSAHLQSRPELAAQADGASLWLAGLLSGAVEEARTWQQLGRQPVLTRYPTIERVNFASRQLSDPASPIGLVNIITFPREIVMVLLTKGPAPRAADALPRWAPPPTRAPGG